ncbi:unnamed protein product [Arabidopsis halleri]
MEWSSALTWKPVMTLVDPSLPNYLPIASSPYRRGGSINTFPIEATLGFCLLGPYHCCGPLTSLSRPIYRSCCGPTPIFDWTSFVSTPLHWLSDYQSRVQSPSIVPTANLPSVAPGSLVVVICYLALAVNSWDWLGLVQPCVSSSDMYVAFPCAPPAIGISWAGFVLNCVCTRIQTGSLFNGQSLPSWALLSIYMTSGGIVSVTLCCGVHRPSNSLLTRLHGRGHLCHKVPINPATITEDRSVLELLGCSMVTIHDLLRVGLVFQGPTQRKDPWWIFFKTLCVICSRSGGTNSQGGYHGGFSIGCIKAGLYFGLSGACSSAQYRWPRKRTGWHISRFRSLSFYDFVHVCSFYSKV